MKLSGKPPLGSIPPQNNKSYYQSERDRHNVSDAVSCLQRRLHVPNQYSTVMLKKGKKPTTESFYG